MLLRYYRKANVLNEVFFHHNSFRLLYCRLINIQHVVQMFLQIIKQHPRSRLVTKIWVKRCQWLIIRWCSPLTYCNIYIISFQCFCLLKAVHAHVKNTCTYRKEAEKDFMKKFRAVLFFVFFGKKEKVSIYNSLIFKLKMPCHDQ